MDNGYYQSIKRITPNKNLTRYISRGNIEVISTNVTVIHDPGMPSYIAHKFPCLQLIQITPALKGAVYVDQNNLKQLLSYLLEFRKACGFNVHRSTMVRTAGDFWDATTKAGNEEVVFLYTDDPPEGDIRLDKKKTTIFYRSFCFRYGPYDFMERNGKLIEKLRLLFWNV